MRSAYLRKTLKGKRDVFVTSFCNAIVLLLRHTLVHSIAIQSKGKRDVLTYEPANQLIITTSPKGKTDVFKAKHLFTSGG